ncbi:hypothetical protein HZA87_05805 [Candidatus Uhrbacteria bacterium]|nr:hypothetical protein [Candidatus Uhrbacteria bacterium]
MNQTLRWPDCQHSLQLVEVAGQNMQCMLHIVKKHGANELVFEIPHGITVTEVEAGWELQGKKWEQLAHCSENGDQPFKAVRIIRIGDKGFVVWMVNHHKDVPNDACEFVGPNPDFDTIISEFMA